MQDAQQAQAPEAYLRGQGLRIAVVQARFNTDITHTLWQACRAELLRLGVQESDIVHHTVAGALEVPQLLGLLSQHRPGFHAMIALGCIIRGETYHFELVANESGTGVTRVALDHNIPIANAILTVENMAQAQARQSVKGTEAAQAAVEMANHRFNILGQ